VVEAAAAPAVTLIGLVAVALSAVGILGLYRFPSRSE
jgi:hypothetical protein